MLRAKVEQEREARLLAQKQLQAQGDMGRYREM